jgi:hypothetical protein
MTDPIQAVFGVPMCAVKFAGPMKIYQLDPDLQTKVKELTMTSLAEFQALAREIRMTQEARWAGAYREAAKP